MTDLRLLPAADKPRVGISACLVGEPVRFDAGHKRDRFVTDALAPFIELVPVCPEMELGLGAPRESMALVAGLHGPRLVGNKSAHDYSAAMNEFSAARVRTLAGGGGPGRATIDGYILKKGSPSCGLGRVRVRPSDDGPMGSGSGLFAAALVRGLDGVPLCEEGWLRDDGLRDNFLAQLFSHFRLRMALAAEPSAGAVVAFHTAHKLLYLAHSPADYRALGRLVAGVGIAPLAESAARYQAAATRALAVPASRGKHTNVLEHAMGFLKDRLAAAEKRELLEVIDAYRLGLEELSAPRTLLLHHMRRNGIAGWLAEQVYWQPYPRAIAARALRAA